MNTLQKLGNAKVANFEYDTIDPYPNKNWKWT